MNAGKLIRFREMMLHFIEELKYQPSLVVHRHIDVSYYLQKAEELKELSEQLQR